MATVQLGVTFNGGNSQYCLGEAARQQLIDDFGWMITDAGKAEDCNLQACDDFLVNDDLSIVLPSGANAAGLDNAVGTSTNTNGSAYAFEISNTDTGQPWSRYNVSLDLASYGIEPGDELFIGIDGNGSGGNARIEVNQDNRANSALASQNFGNDWSRFETTVTVPSDIATIDLWLLSNYNRSSPGTVVYDNLNIVNLSDEGGNRAPIANAGTDITVIDTDESGTETVTLDASGSTDRDQNSLTYSWTENGVVIATGVNATVGFNVGVHTITLQIFDGELTDEDTIVVTVSEVTTACPDSLVNEDPAIVLVGGTSEGGLDTVSGTTIITNGSPCAFELINGDGGQPWARYQVSLNLASYGIEPGDELLIGIDGNGAAGNARIEVNQDSRPNSALVSRTFGNAWSRFETSVTVPSGISTIDLWLFSNYASSTAGTAVYDNLNIVNLNDTAKAGRIASEVENESPITVSIGQDTEGLGGSNAFSMSTYPNPSSDKVTVYFTQPTAVTEFRFFDIQGRLVQTVGATESGPKTDFSLDVYELPVGTYFLRVFDEVGRIHQKQLVIQR